MTVYDVLNYLASGVIDAEILADLPEFTAHEVRACLAFAADRDVHSLPALPGVWAPGLDKGRALGSRSRG